MKQETAHAIIHKNRESYNQMAGEFSASRARFWDELAELATYANEGDTVLDIGCGNGRFFPLIQTRGATYVGMDNSQGLLKEAERQYPDATFVEGDGTLLPFPDASFDVAYSFAVIHHVPSKELRAQFVREAARILKPKGTLVITTWEIWQAKYFWKLVQTALRSILGLSPLDIGDVMLTFGNKKHARYVHAFTTKEFANILETNGFIVNELTVIKRKSGAANIVAVATKKD